MSCFWDWTEITHFTCWSERSSQYASSSKNNYYATLSVTFNRLFVLNLRISRSTVLHAELKYSQFDYLFLNQRWVLGWCWYFHSQHSNISQLQPLLSHHFTWRTWACLKSFFSPHFKPLREYFCMPDLWILQCIVNTKHNCNEGFV